MSSYNEQHSFKHRDISWLSFNGRVLQEAADIRNPLYERIRFLAIFSSNLDEFFRVRVSKLRQIKNVDSSLQKKLNIEPTKILRTINARVEEQQQLFGRLFQDDILPALAQNGVLLLGYESFNTDQRQFAKAFFEKDVRKRIEIVPYSSSEVPFLTNNSLYFYVCFDDGTCSFVSIPSDSLDRFITLPSEDSAEASQLNVHSITFLDDIVAQELPGLFPEQRIRNFYEIKLSRDAELYWDDNYDGGIVELIEASLSQRNVGQPTRLLHDFRMPKADRDTLGQLLDLAEIDLFPGGKYHNYSDFMDFPDPTENASLHFKPLPPIAHSVLASSTDRFAAIREKDQLLHYPYHSFDHVLKFLDDAASDPLVKTIKIALYRIASDSQLSESLLNALKNGKEIIVFVEPKARFDEANNLGWGKKFKDEGAKVFFSDIKIKVHSKILMVERLENDTLCRYAYISTGNFNRKTSKIYADHALFTANPKLTDELAQVFEVLQRKKLAPITKHLLVSPFSTRITFNQLIDNEIKNVNNGIPGSFKAKMNSLEDDDLITKIYDAANAGVQIELLVRGFCCLDMNEPGVKDNVRITSVVDRYLEHGRIYWFENGGKEKLYIGSADWMGRNMDKRIEVLTPIYDDELFAELKHILQLQLNDNVKARIIDSEEQNSYVPRAADEKRIRSQYAIYDFLEDKHKKL
ncbi:MAG TPA: polyphosphate kinase 1 [Pricia antarctica]|uniref:Polyphosphate kinase n=3 Tax=root TaxID=1 RepID=A0A831QUU8_9FLAO|nr:polyphosphate kinase 1 [Pricia antarctica]